MTIEHTTIYHCQECGRVVSRPRGSGAQLLRRSDGLRRCGCAARDGGSRQHLHGDCSHMQSMRSTETRKRTSRRRPAVNILRFDYTTADWVVYAPLRKLRPHREGSSPPSQARLCTTRRSFVPSVPATKR